MSSTTIIGFSKDGEQEHIKELHNAHGAAPVVWGGMCEKYYLADRSKWVVDSNILDKIWVRWKDLSMPEHHRAVLMMTFDYAYIEKEYYKRAANDIRKWLDDFSVPDNHVNHWPEIAELYESNPDYCAIGIWHTSVSGNPFLSEWNEDKQDYEPIGFDDLDNIYAELDSLPEV